MTKRKIMVEHVLCYEKEFEFPDDLPEEEIHDYIVDLYKKHQIGFDSPTLVQANLMICEEDGKETDWCDMHLERVGK